GLLEAQELDDTEIDGRVEAQTALVGSQGRVELDAKAAVDLHFAFVVDPGYAEDDLPLRLANALDQAVVGIVRMLRDDAPEALENFADGLMKLCLAGVTTHDLGKY